MTEIRDMPSPVAEDSDVVSSQTFQNTIYCDLDAGLRNTPWNSGVAEAHGLLSALACLGTEQSDLRSKAWLFRLELEPHIAIIDGLYALVCRDLEDAGFRFLLLLPDDNAPLPKRIEAVSDWCQGFVQGIYHIDGRLPNRASPAVHEAVNSILEIGHLEAAGGDNEDSERALIEIIEFLRVATQLVYDSLQPDRPPRPEFTQPH